MSDDPCHVDPDEPRPRSEDGDPDAAKLLEDMTSAGNVGTPPEAVGGVTPPGMGRVAMRGGISTTASRVATVGIGLVATAALARLLRPEDFGLVAKVTALTGLINLLGELGTSIAVVQAPALNRDQEAAFFWWNGLVSLGLGVILAAASPLIAAFYADTRVIGITLIIALAVTIRGVGVVPLALLRRRCAFTTVSVIHVAATVFAAIVAVMLTRPLGHYALPAQTAALAVMTTLGAVVVSGGIPGIRFRRTGIGGQFRLGMNFTAIGLVNYFARNLDNILIGKYISEAALANYTKAYGLLMLPLSQVAQPISQVAVPTLSRLQDRPEEYRRIFLRGASLSFLVQVPASILVACAARPLVLTMLGDQWTRAIPIFYALAPAVLTSTTAPGTYWIIPSLGLAGRQFWIVCVNTAIIISAIVVGLRFGVLGVAYAFSAASVLLRYPSLLYSMKPSPVGVHEFLATGLVPLGASVIAGASCLGAAAAWEPTSAPLALLYRSLVFTIVYVVCVWRTSPGRRAWAMTRRHLLPKLPGKLAGCSTS